MPVSRVAIEHALDAIASNEGGMGFQGLAVVLAKLRWPELIRCERKWDPGLDAHAPAITIPVACRHSPLLVDHTGAEENSGRRHAREAATSRSDGPPRD